ncbi:ubiquitin thiolesterase [Apiospora kogelbergensis]|uniref:ubiquitin thiolesterase n=1 Tax=Apiospora kogelbergensis TaxID=1337665 RepID=UPI00312DACB7
MNGSHLPAGQPMPGGVGGVPGGRGPVEMGHVPTAGNGPRRRGPQHFPSHQPSHQPSYYHQQHHNAHHNHNPMYYSAPMNPYATSYYPQQMPHYYQNNAMPASPYVPHHPPTRRGLLRLCISSILLSCLRPSPAISTPPVYATTLPPPPVPVPQAPSSTHSPQTAVQPPLTPSTPHTQISPPPPAPQPEVEVARPPFRAPLPWLSRPDLPFPTRAARSRRRRKILTTDASNVRLPNSHQGGVIDTLVEPTGSETITNPSVPETPAQRSTTSAPSSAASLGSVDRSEVPSTQGLPSETAQPTSTTTPTSTQASQAPVAANVAHPKAKPVSRAAAPAVPVIPKTTKAAIKDPKGASSNDRAVADQTPTASQQPPTDAPVVASSASVPVEEMQPAAAPAPVKPKLWTGLFANASAAAAANQGSQAVPETATSGAVESGEANGNSTTDTGTFTKTNASSLAEAVALFRVGKGQKLAFLKPRGLINTGNMCYMNSVLQVLIFCTPFYDFLDQISKKAVHSFKSETPLVDAMIMFMREFQVIDSAASVEQLRMRLKSEELEQYGEPFTPEFVYDVIRKLPRFASMQRGHQQDAEEFLGFLLETLQDEIEKVMDKHTASTAATAATPAAVSSPTATADMSDWMEVGPKQRAAVTRSSGNPVTFSPITQIFGGKLRSEVKVPGLKDSVTYEPFQPLQLDIGSPQVRNIVDALRNLTLPEPLHGDFDSPRGPDAVVTKQFDAQGNGTLKIWKKVGYPLELELPKEVYSRQKRSVMAAEGTGLPKYRLIAAVYHHGKNASGGHYTADVRRQEGREWIRIDDTVIRRVRSEDVAEGGQEENAGKEASRSDQKRDTASGASGNRFEGIGGDDEVGDDEGWNQVATPASGAKKWSSVVNGNRTAAAAAAAAPPPPKGSSESERKPTSALAVSSGIGTEKWFRDFYSFA